MDDFKSQVKKSFSLCKKDIQDLKDENVILKKKIKKHEEEIIELKSELKGIKIALDILKNNNINLIKNNIEENNNINNVNKKSSNNNLEHKKINKNPEINKKEDPYEDLLKFKAKINKRDILKQKLISMIQEQGMFLAELKFLFVDHYKYCSKATFYNYLKELELEKIVEIKRERNKNYIYLIENIKTYNR